MVGLVRFCPSVLGLRCRNFLNRPCRIIRYAMGYPDGFDALAFILRVEDILDQSGKASFLNTVHRHAFCNHDKKTLYAGGFFK